MRNTRIASIIAILALASCTRDATTDTTLGAPAAAPAPDLLPTAALAPAPRAIAVGADKVPAQEGDSPSCEKSCEGRGDKGESVVGDAVEDVPIARAASRGSAFAPITIVEFGDYQCPFSAKSEATIHAVESAHAGDVRFVFKNLPLPMHDRARDMARAAIAADAQGRYWPMHERLFASGHGGVDRPGLDKIAADLGLDVARFDRDMSDPATDARIDADQQDADKLGVKGTPTFFVNGHRVVGAQAADTFENAIARAK